MLIKGISYRDAFFYIWISRKQSVKKTREEYQLFKPTQKYITDFDKQVRAKVKNLK